MGFMAREALKQNSTESNAINKEAKNHMELGGIIIAISIATVIVIGGVVMLFSKKSKKGSSNTNNRKYSEKDKDMLKLISELSEVYQKTDDYLHISR